MYTGRYSPQALSELSHSQNTHQRSTATVESAEYNEKEIRILVLFGTPQRGWNYSRRTWRTVATFTLCQLLDFILVWENLKIQSFGCNMNSAYRTQFASFNTMVKEAPPLTLARSAWWYSTSCVWNISLSGVFIFLETKPHFKSFSLHTILDAFFFVLFSFYLLFFFLNLFRIQRYYFPCFV